jgi:hypothetical protein
MPEKDVWDVWLKVNEILSRVLHDSPPEYVWVITTEIMETIKEGHKRV